MNEELYLTIEELAEALNVSIATLTRWARTQQGPEHYRVGQELRYPLSAFLSWRQTFDPKSVDYRHTPRIHTDKRHWLTPRNDEELPTKAAWSEGVRKIVCGCGAHADPTQIFRGKVRGNDALWATCPNCKIPLGEPWIER